MDTPPDLCEAWTALTDLDADVVCVLLGPVKAEDVPLEGAASSVQLAHHPPGVADGVGGEGVRPLRRVDSNTHLNMIKVFCLILIAVHIIVHLVLEKLIIT